MYSKCIVLIAVAVITVSARTASVAQENVLPQEKPRSLGSSSLLSDAMYAYDTYKKCAGEPSCLKLKLLATLDRASRSMSEFSVLGVKIVRNSDAPENPPPQTEAEIEANVPRSLTDREDKLNGLIADKVSNFLATHSLQVNLPSIVGLENAISDEGRAKKKKKFSLSALPLLLGGAIVPILLGGLSLLVFKALITAKIALVLAGILAFKKLFGGHSSAAAIYPAHDTHEVVVPATHGFGWARAYDKAEAQKLAYNAYTPNTSGQ